MIELRYTYERLLACGWSSKTTGLGTYDIVNRAKGQDAVTAMAVQDAHGGFIIRVTTTEGQFYANAWPAMDRPGQFNWVDLTAMQRKPYAVIGSIETTSPDGRPWRDTLAQHPNVVKWHRQLVKNMQKGKAAERKKREKRPDQIDRLVRAPGRWQYRADVVEKKEA